MSLSSVNSKDDVDNFNLKFSSRFNFYFIKNDLSQGNRRDTYALRSELFAKHGLYFP